MRTIENSNETCDIVLFWLNWLVYCPICIIKHWGWLLKVDKSFISTFKKLIWISPNRHNCSLFFWQALCNHQAREYLRKAFFTFAYLELAAIFTFYLFLTDLNNKKNIWIWRMWKSFINNNYYILTDELSCY
jgi:hypothetical protein